MMRATFIVAALLGLAGCNFAVKHPAATAGIVAGSVSLVTCELASEAHKPCFIASGAVGVGLALVAAGALWLGSEDEPETKSEPPPKIDWSKVPDTTPKEPTKAPPPVGSGSAPATPPAPSNGSGSAEPPATPPSTGSGSAPAPAPAGSGSAVGSGSAR